MALLPQIKTRVALHAHRQTRGLLDGEYAAAQVGRSMEFNDLRDYVRGDDVKDIDWKASARTRSLLVKRFEAVRKHTLTIVASSGRSMAAHLDADTTKREVAVFTAGVVGLTAVRHGDQVGLVHGDAVEQHAVPAGSGELHLERCLESLHAATTTDTAPADLAALFAFVAKNVRRRTLMLLVCDEEDLDEDAVAGLRRLVVQHEVLVLLLGDLRPATLTADRSNRVVDVDTGTSLPGWALTDRQLAEDYASAVGEGYERLAVRLDSLGVVHERVHDGPTALAAVFRLLERHRRAGRR